MSKKMGRPLRMDAVKEVKKIRKEHPTLSIRMIAKLIESKLGFLPDPKSVWRWERVDI